MTAVSALDDFVDGLLGVLGEPASCFVVTFVEEQVVADERVRPVA